MERHKVLILKQGKKVCKATALRSCHCFPCTMLPGLSRANWLPENKSYSALLLTAAERCKNLQKFIAIKIWTDPTWESSGRTWCCDLFLAISSFFFSIFGQCPPFLVFPHFPFRDQQSKEKWFTTHDIGRQHTKKEDNLLCCRPIQTQQREASKYSLPKMVKQQKMHHFKQQHVEKNEIPVAGTWHRDK